MTYMITVQRCIEAKMLECFRRVEEEGEELIVTHNSVPVLKVVPLKKNLSVEEAFGDLRGKVEYHGYILEPETEEWGDVYSSSQENQRD